LPSRNSNGCPRFHEASNSSPERNADVVHRDLRALRRLGAVADDDVVDHELERDVAVGLVDLRALGSHGAGCYSHSPSRMSRRPRSSFASRQARTSVGFTRRYT
jgi:hypothetical protein